jgi:hypothetical protein
MVLREIEWSGIDWIHTHPPLELQNTVHFFEYADTNVYLAMTRCIK